MNVFLDLKTTMSTDSHQHWHSRFRRIAPYIADVGASVFAACAVLALAVVAFELRASGSAVRYLSPQALVAVAVVVGAVSLLVPSRQPSFVARTGYTLAALVATALAGSAAWHATAAFGAFHTAYIVAAALVTFTAFIALRRSGPST